MTERSAAEWVQEGLAYHQQGSLEAAQERYQRALELDSASADALHFLGMARFQGGESESAEELIQQSVEMRPDSATYRYNLAQFLEGQGRLTEALWAYDLALTLNPTMASALNERGRLLMQGERMEEAEAAFRDAIAVDPNAPEAYTNLGLLLWDQGDLPGALEYFREACVKGPGLLPAQFHRARLLVQMGRVQEVLEAVQEAAYAGLVHPRLEVQRAQAEKILGSLETAADRLEAVLAEHPDDLQVLYNLAPLAGKLNRVFPREQAEALLQSPELNQEARGFLAFALGAYLDARKEHDAAFMYWLEGNQAEEHQASAEEQENRVRYWRTLRQAFSPSVVDDLANWGAEEPTPIFVVGTPRSGTTLVEQILASHPRVTGVGESGAIQEVLREHLQDSDLEMGGEPGQGLTRERSVELARIYWNKLQELAPGAERIVDKTPGNLHNLGLIWTLFPSARVVMTRRNPLDAGVSMFSLRFTWSVEFAFDMEVLGRYLREIPLQMAHWEDVLPESFLLPLDYEALVTDSDHQVERLLNHCGLEWDPACLRFFETERAVQTASQDQVRQPLYRSAVQRWPRYEHHLLPLARAAGMEDRLSAEARKGFRSFSRLGERQLERGQVQEAAGSFRRAMLWETDRRGWLHERLGRALEAAERFREAAACFRSAWEAGVFGAQPEARTGLALAQVRNLRKAGEIAPARQVLEAAAIPEGPERWTEEGWLRLAENLPAEAEPYFRAALAEAETDEALEGWVGALKQADRRAEIQEELEGLAAAFPKWEAPARLLAQLHADQGELDRGEGWAQKAQDQAPHCHRVRTLWARLHFLRDQPHKAGNALKDALRWCPDHFAAHLLLARLNLSQQDTESAEASARAALGLREDPQARLTYGRARFMNGYEEEGLAAIRAVRRGHPDRPEAWWEEVGSLMEATRTEEAWALLEEARARFPEDERLRFRELRFLRQAGADAETVREGLQNLSSEWRDTPSCLAELGHVNDRLGYTDQAMACFGEANARFARSAVARRFPKEVALSRVARLRSTVTEDWVKTWRVPPQPSGWEHPPVFLLGFPRSGTTLLDQILASHSQVEVLSERPVFDDVANQIRRRYGGDLKGLAAMDQAGIAEMQAYYRQVRDQYQQDPDAPVVVDKMPLRTVEAAMVYRLFPDAHFLFARRHPADCVLSCFMQIFAPNVAMANFHTLHDGARYYRAVMELWHQYRELFPTMQVHEVRYEELVADFDTVAGGMLAFLGLPWEEGVRHYRETARSRGRIATPSRSQVTQPLYDHARYRWRRYRDHFGDAWELLRPFMESAGYPVK